MKYKKEYKSFELDGCFIDNNKQFVLIHIFKNASISIRNALKMRGNYITWKEAKKIDNIKTLCVFRDPTTRFISAYQYILKLKDEGAHQHRHPRGVTQKTDFYKFKNDPFHSFCLFVDFIEKKGFYDAVTVPQVDFLAARNLNIDQIDYVLVQDRLEKDYDLFCKENGIANLLQKNNTGNESVKDLILTNLEANLELKERILSLYSEDQKIYEDLL